MLLAGSGDAPGLIIGGLFLPTVPLIVLERLRPLQALSRAVQMMKPHLLRGTAVFAFVVLISGVLPLAIQAFLGDGPFSPLLGAINSHRSAKIPPNLCGSVCAGI